MEALIDYRNARYQGDTNEKEARHGYGILIDDDLSFYASHWHEGRINASTVIYISHAKYIYGQWQDNEPQGLNVFRIGDTVVLGEFDNGYLVKKIVVIFERLNFVAILEDRDGDWAVCQRGVLRGYNELVKYIEEANIPMKPQYFSLTKFLTSISNEKAGAVPCQGTENCYYGFDEGLGIIFNPSNGVVSVGYHSNRKLTECGGKYEHPNFVVQGNFQTGQILKYSNERPKQQIYSIYQKLHKRSLTFKNEYFDSKVKLLTHIEQLIRSKIDSIMDQKDQENTFTAVDLNDSLDYHAENLEEINKVREAVYENVHIPMKKAVSQYTDDGRSGKRAICVTPTKKKMEPIINAPASPMIMKKSPIKIKQKEKQKEREREVIRTPTKKSYLNRQEAYQYREQTFANIEEPPVKNQERELSRTPSKRTIQTKPETKQYRRDVYTEEIILTKQSYSQNEAKSVSSSSIKRPICQARKSPYQPKQPNEEYNDQEASPVDQLLVSSKDYFRQKEMYNVPSFKYSCSEFDKGQPVYQQRTTRGAEVKLSGSEKLERLEKVERVERTTKIQNVEWVDSSAQSRSSVSPMNNSKKYSEKANQMGETSKSPIKGPNYQNLSQRRKRLLKQFKNLNNENENPVGTLLSKLIPSLSNRVSSIIPANPVNHSQSTSEPPMERTSTKQKQDCYELQSPCAREKFPKYESKNTEQQSETFLPLTICSGNEQVLYNGRKEPMPMEKEYKFTRQYSQKQSYLTELSLKSAQRLSYKENVDSSAMGGRPFEKKESFYQRQEKTEQDAASLTPNRRKTYRYYFDE